MLFEGGGAGNCRWKVHNAAKFENKYSQKWWRRPKKKNGKKRGDFVQYTYEVWWDFATSRKGYIFLHASRIGCSRRCVLCDLFRYVKILFSLVFMSDVPLDVVGFRILRDAAPKCRLGKSQTLRTYTPFVRALNSFIFQNDFFFLFDFISSFVAVLPFFFLKKKRNSSAHEDRDDWKKNQRLWILLLKKKKIFFLVGATLTARTREDTAHTHTHGTKTENKTLTKCFKNRKIVWCWSVFFFFFFLFMWFLRTQKFEERFSNKSKREREKSSPERPSFTQNGVRWCPIVNVNELSCKKIIITGF